jgi:hypothetical protein
VDCRLLRLALGEEEDWMISLLSKGIDRRQAKQ